MKNEGDALRYEAVVDLSELNTARTQLVLLTGPNKKVLEVGPATGYITKALRDQGCRVTGLEIDPAAARRAEEFAERMIVGDIEALDLGELFGEERFDVVMYGDVLEHLTDPEKVLVQTRSILNAGGYVVASIPNVAHGSVRLALLTGQFRYRPDGLLDRTHIRFFTRETVYELFEAAGYELREVRASTTDAFGTELGLRSEDFPPSLVEAVRSLPDADAYQFIMAAHPVAARKRADTTTDREAPVTRVTAAPLWGVEDQLTERDQTIRKLTEEVEWLRDVNRRAEEERDAARDQLERVRASRAYRLSAGLVGRFRRVFPKRARQPQRVPLRADEPPYREWIERFEPGPEELARQRRASRRLSDRPLFSMLIAGGGAPSALLRRTMGSLKEQTYDRWEPRVAADAASALASAKGDYTVFLSPGDLLAPFALHEMAVALNREPAFDVLYSDRDEVSEDGRRSRPFFTPSWSPELLLSADYLSHLLVVRTELLRQVGASREKNTDTGWDLAFRVTEQTDRVGRIPKILCHRATGSVERTTAAPGVVQQHLERTGRSGTVERTPQGHVRIRWQVDGDPKVSVIIPTLHNRPLLLRCLSAIERAAYRNLEILVVDTAGREPDREAWHEDIVRRFGTQVLWWERPFNYSAVNNWAAARASGDVLLFLNDDTEAVGEDWLTELVGWAQQEPIGAVGAQLLNEDGTIQHGGIVVGMTGFAGQLFKFLRPGDWSLLGSTMWYRNVLAVTGACLAMRRDVFERIGGWNERYILAGSDVELGLRLVEAGYRVVCTPFAQLRHREQATRGSHIPEEDFHTSFEDYRPYLLNQDPYFNPNLSYDDTIPRLTTGDDRNLEIVSRIIGRDLDAEAPRRPSLSERA
ncbi:MAG TPA: methyltransferase domain-containing protein [Actinomycetota bacterium]|nr:methyltransferase domain-containing protein [Actinomycetota bacterium]